MKIIVFGVGAYYQNRRDSLREQAEIVAYVDNNSNLWGKEIDHIKILKPERVLNIECDAIVLMSSHAYEMRKQLLSFGVAEARIMNYFQLLSYINKDVMTWNISKDNREGAVKVAIATVRLTYHGGILAACNLAQALKKKNYNVYMVVPPIIDENLLQEIIASGCNVIICGKLMHASYEELLWLDEFKYIIASTFQMVHFVSTVGQRRNLIWWLHEPECIYDGLRDEMYLAEKEFSQLPKENVKVFAASNVAKMNYKKYYPNRAVDILLPCIPDTNVKKHVMNSTPFIFAIIGGISENKSQLHFLKAIERLKFQGKIEFWLIGDVPETKYANEVKLLASKIPEVKVLGLKSRTEMEKLLQQIDVVVCASMEETLSLTIVEGMMCGKLCVTTDTAGIADFICEGENGFVYESQNTEQLAAKMQWIISHKGELNNVREAARITYEEYFSMKVMENRIEFILDYSYESGKERVL